MFQKDTQKTKTKNKNNLGEICKRSTDEYWGIAKSRDEGLADKTNN